MNSKSIFFISLKDTTNQLHYWKQSVQNWTTDFSDATKFTTLDEARNEATYGAELTTTAEVIVQQMLIEK